MMKWNLSIVFIACLLFGFSPPADAAQKWTVKGRVVVNHVLPELVDAFGAQNGVGGITVKVSARSRLPFNTWGTWRSWGQIKTGANGRFTVSENHGGDRRQFRVKILFDSDELRIKEGQETSVSLNSSGFPLDIDFDLSDKDWHIVHNDKNGAATDGRKAGVIDLGDVLITRKLIREHADLWIAYNKVFDLFGGYGSAYAFKNKVVLKYPMGIGNNNAASASYTNPVTNQQKTHIYIKGGDFDLDTIYHELMHGWAFERTTGESAMAWQLGKHGSTHQTRENTTHVPAHEGFADWAPKKILREVTDGALFNFENGGGHEYPDFPYSREYVGDALHPSERFLANVDYTERGWYSLFNILSYGFLDRVDFNRPLIDRDPPAADTREAFVSLFSTRSCPEKRTGFSLKEVLSIFNKYPNKGIDKYMGNNELNFRSFLARAGAILSGLDSDQIKAVKSYLNPNQTVNPCLD